MTKNNVDIAIAEIRELQAMIFDNNLSRNDLFNKTQTIINTMDRASIEINTNYESISQKLTDRLNSGKS
jgi:hypothetical protein